MRLPRKPVAVVFDMDGLLFDTESLYEEATLSAATSLGYDMGRPFFRTTVGSHWPVIRGLLLDHYGAAFPAEELRAVARQNFQGLVDSRQFLKSGVLELLDLLDERHLPRAIATTSAHPTVQHHLEVHDLAGRFHHIVAAGDYAQHKPAPDPFLKAAERLGVEPRLCLALEDSHNGVRSAASAGMMTVMVPDLLEPTADITRLCAAVAADLHEVHRLLSDAGDEGR
ncbi:MAG: HAD family phosphatase [Reyranella sp.]|nr:HAD family phosphatase [Reyranella sp.]